VNCISKIILSLTQVEVYGTKTAGTPERWAPAQPFDFAGWTLLASAPSAERNLGFNLPTIYNAGGGNGCVCVFTGWQAGLACAI